MGEYNIGMTNKQIEEIVGNLLVQHKLTLSVAESCTGGLIGHLITNVPGSSAYFRGGTLAYANEIKMGLLGVSRETLDQYGAVCKQTVLEMAKGVRKQLGTDLGISVSGIAGPGGGTPEKPVGLVWVGLSAPDREIAKCFHFIGNRQDVKQQSAEQALEILADYLSSS